MKSERTVRPSLGTFNRRDTLRALKKGEKLTAQLHIITGKGGVGKSTVAASLAQSLSERNEGPVLLIDVQGSGRSLELLGHRGTPFANTWLPASKKVWGSRILPRESFKQYFSHLLSLGSEHSTWAQLTSVFRDKLVDLVFENRIVSAFVDVCPGLEPAVLLGKIHWEASHGVVPGTAEAWRHVVVDAPSTGHGLMLFKSTHALTEVFSTGLIFKQASQIMRDIRDPNLSKIYIVSLLEELPLRESFELASQLRAMALPSPRYLINRSPLWEDWPELPTAPSLDEVWLKEALYERELWKEKKSLLEEFKRSLGPDVPLYFLPEIIRPDPAETLSALCKKLMEQGL